MTIHQMECFLEAAKTLNFTEAASRLYISQQGLSRQIASLEKELELRFLLIVNASQNTSHIR